METIKFKCNLCDHINISPLSALNREEPSCSDCGSTVRMRSIILGLSLGLFNKPLALSQYPNDRSIIGLGMSDWDGYAKPLAKKLGYINTYYHQEPRFDITQPSASDFSNYDFVISTDVFEHVAPPISEAFRNVIKILKPGGVFVFSVPYSIENEDTVEHFPNLKQFEIKHDQQGFFLRNMTSHGQVEEFRNLVFHGGGGSTLELRVFSEKSMLRELNKAGFRDVRILGADYLEYGIHWPEKWSLPLIAFK